MKRVLRYASKHRRKLLIAAAMLFAISFLLLYQLGTLTDGLSARELKAVNNPVGWHGIFTNAYYLPLQLLRSIAFFTINDYGDFLARLPNTFFGLVSVASFAYIIRRWHGVRTSVLATAMFATSAWFLHASRLASFDVMYLCAIPILICSGILLQKRFNQAWVFYGTILVWGTLLYTPGLIWLVLLTLYWQKEAIAKGWNHFNAALQRLLYVGAGLVWLPLLIIQLLRPHQLLLWIGAPAHFAAPLTVVKQFGAVFVHLFLKGPLYPEIWLGRIPILDIFASIMCITGIYFYAVHRKAFRSRLLLSYFVVGVILVGLHGAVTLSLLVPLLYIVTATGIAFLLHEWLSVFPLNPFARGVGITLISVAVLMSCAYNLRSYFIAWPHNATTQAIFRYHR